jgi:hypothetical protein
MMPCRQHLDVRTTLTLDDDLAAKLQDEARRTGRSFQETVDRDFSRFPRVRTLNPLEG